jgi:hypothetical protein
MEQKIKVILSRNNFAKRLSLDNKSLNSFVDSILLDIKYSSQKARSFPCLKQPAYIKYLVVLFGVLHSNIQYIFRICNTHKFDFSKVKFIFLPFSDKNFIRFKHIPEILSENYILIYPPAFHINGLLKHLNYFRSRNIRVHTPFFGFRIFIQFTFEVIRLSSMARQISRQISNEISTDTANRFQGGFLMIILHKLFMDKLLDSINLPTHNKILWFFDFDKDYKYIAYNSEIKQRRGNDQTVHIQHGLFWDNNICYIRPNTDFMFCCSEREKQIISSSILEKNRIFVTGAPLQTFDFIDVENTIKSKIEYDYLILLSDSLSSHFELQCNILSFFRTNNNITYAVRLRPMSKSFDIQNFRDFLDMDHVTHNSTLSQDIEKATSIISFSEDALLECFRRNKLTIYGHLDKIDFIDKSNALDSPFSLFTNYREFLNLIERQKINSIAHSDNFIRKNFGEIDFEKMKKNFLANIEEIY